MAVPGRRELVPTSSVELGLGHAPQPTRVSGTPRVPSRDMRLNPPGFEPPGSDMIMGLCMDEWARGEVPFGLIHTRPHSKRGAHMDT